MEKKGWTRKLMFKIPFLISIILIIYLCFFSSGKEDLSDITNTSTRTLAQRSQGIDVFTKTPNRTPTKSYYALGTVTVNLCNLRQGPGTDYPIIDNSKKGETHKIYGTNSEKTWLLLDEQESIWIALSLVSLDTDISNIPIIETYSILKNFKVPGESNQQPNVNSTQSFEKVQVTQSIKEPAPTQFAGCPDGCTFHYPGCDIKGNISYKSGEKIYHVPGGEFYDECVINPDYGERWFCTEQEARLNGWRKSEK